MTEDTMTKYEIEQKLISDIGMTEIHGPYVAQMLGSIK